MPGLIPLTLQPASPGCRDGVVFPPLATRSSHRRHASTGSLPAPALRQRQSLPNLLPSLPFTDADWRQTIADVKSQHLSRRYRACSTKCCEIIDSASKSQVEPVYLIYLHLYAATSMEACARPLQSPSPYRTSLLRSAKGHYDEAASLIQSAEHSVATKTRSSSSASSRSSMHSPSGSVSSIAWTETSLSSPTESVCSLDDFAARPGAITPPQEPKRRIVKKVSFLLPGEEMTVCPEPVIRPDSPTLGFDDYFFTPAAQQPAELPKPPQPRLDEVEIAADLPPPEEVSFLNDRDDFLVSRSVHRYYSHLTSLRVQIASHKADVETLMSGTGGSDFAEVERHTEASQDIRLLDRQARIERLRKAGWQRKRFDARRYEELCDAAMAELA